MPRRRKAARAFVDSSKPRPFTEWTLRELEREKKATTGESFKNYSRHWRAHDEIDRRFELRIRSGPPLSDRALRRWSKMLGESPDYVRRAAEYARQQKTDDGQDTVTCIADGTTKRTRSSRYESPQSPQRAI